MSRWILSVLLVASSLPFARTTPVALAAAASDIPGTTLPSRTVNSSVGGATVDEVYSIYVPSGSVMIATIRGEAGAELGLYLFGPEAVAIATSTPIAQSARPGGVQSVSLAIETGGMHFININGRNENRSYQYTLSIAIARDTSPPTFVNVNMAGRARSSEVCADVEGNDVTSGVREIRVRESDNPSAAVWSPYSGRGRYCIAVGEGDGARSFDVAIRNGVGLVSATRTFSVVIDDQAPTIVRAEPVQRGVMYEPRGSITWEFSERIQLNGVTGDNIYAVSQAGTRIAGVAKLLDRGLRVRWTPTSGIPVGSVLLVSIAGVSDRAGNAALAIDSLEIYRKQRSILGLFPGRITSKWAWFTYKITKNLAGKELLVETLVGDTWQIYTLISEATAGGSFRVERTSGSAIRIRWAGDERVDASRSRRLGL